MRAINVFRKFILVKLMFLFTLSSFGQLLGIKDHNVDMNNQFLWGPDTNLPAPAFESYGEVLDYVFGNLDAHLETNILSDRTPDISKKDQLNGLTFKSSGDLNDFYRIYTEMSEGYVPYQNHLSVFQIDSAIRHSYPTHNTVPIGLFRFGYDQIIEAAKRNNLVYWDGYEVKTSAGATYEDMFEHKETSMLCALRNAQLDEGLVRFVLQREFYYSNVNDSLVGINIDFDDGLGFRPISFDQEVEVFYSTDGPKKLKYSLIYESGITRRGASRFSTRSSDPLISYDCGAGAIIPTGSEFRDFPQQIIGLNEPEVIVNPANEGELKAQMGIYYGCGNGQCQMRKPFIIVTGFGPDTFIAPQRTLTSSTAEGLLYNSINGIFGSEAAGNQDPGQNSGSNLLYKLRNDGYDVVILYFENGTDYVQNHAALVESCIETVNQLKAQSGSKYENIILGQSMGGISTRYALAKWEQERMQDNNENFRHHQCKLWISFEGEMQGATIPLGIQAGALYLTTYMPIALAYTFLGGAASLPLGGSLSLLGYFGLFKELLINPAAKSMLTYHYSVNDHNSSSTTIRHGFFTQLQNELQELGYPNYPRRVAIANGSSTVTRPLDLVGDINSPLYGGQCISSLSFTNPLFWTTGSMTIKTEKIFHAQQVFRSKLKQYGISIPGNNFSIHKNYDRAESIAPGAYERFYQGFFAPIANIGSCERENYRLSFVPTTSVFDIQDDNSPDYNYNVSERLFFRELDLQDVNDQFGYPHNNSMNTNLSSVTPFESCYASELNEFHIQNPSLDLTNFILLESRVDNVALQNKIIHGSPFETYTARYDARDIIVAGSNITSTSVTGDFIIEEDTDVELESQRIELKDGFKAAAGARVLFTSSFVDPIAQGCFVLDGEEGFLNKRNDSMYSAEIENRTHFLSELKVFPNPTHGPVQLEIPDHLVGGKIICRDLTGRIILTQKAIKNRQEIEIENQPHISFIAVEKDGEIQTAKIIKL